MRFTFDGRSIEFRDGDTLGSALHRAGTRVLSRSMKYHRPRGLYCCTGSCAGCFVDVDGTPNVPACMTRARNGMALRSQNTMGTAKHDLLGIVDKVYQKGFDPHGAFTRPRLLNAAFLRTVRLMSGLGKVPDGPGSRAIAPKRHQHEVEHLVIGGGREGLRAAGPDSLLVEELPQLGGSANWDPGESETRDLMASLQAKTWTDALAFGIYGDTVAVRRGDDLHEVRAKRITIAPGRHDAWPLFPNNDMPGVLSLRGARRLIFQHGVLPGRRIVGHGAPLPDDLVEEIGRLGGKVVAQGYVDAVKGGASVEKAHLDTWVACDTVVCALPGTPRVELFQQAGCRLDFAMGALGPTLTDGHAGTTTVPHIEGAFGGAA